MAKPKLSSLLVFGVEWGPVERVAPTEAVDRCADQLLERFGQRQFHATWAVRDLRSPTVQRIRSQPIAQEVALDATAETPRDRQLGFAFAAWLRDRVQDAERVGVSLRSLVLAPIGCVPYQTVTKLGIRTVRPGRGHSRSHRFAQPVQPQPLRHGVWGLPVSMHWPQPNRLFQRFAQQQVVYSVRRAARQDAVLHLVFDLGALTAQGDAAMRAVDRLLDMTAELRDQHQLQVARLMDVEHLVRLETAARPMRSILRRTG